ncbi:hypothetical protein E4P41_08565 [Geodermatophilus sp. DF01-2]|uniref:hypothetical protein n=1 Tax=Geodermatophilus sp. DF01-2 TaxID=2559610 RepID=UPI0010740203|nr:hypothetical protein [Geodermatophilus sp. DF01_2]TFV62043.1 hypothetical protein E4P41_08565 [Geodermatophilus sp. DF01_2]
MDDADEMRLNRAMNVDDYRMSGFRHIPAVATLGDFLPLSGESSSRHADILIGEIACPQVLSLIEDVPWPGRSLLKRVGLGRGLDRHECVDIATGFIRYHSALRDSTDWLLPELVEVMTHQEKSEWHVWILENYIRGSALNDVTASPRRSSDDRVKVYRRVLGRLLSHPKLNQTIKLGDCELSLMSVGIDLKPSNVVVADDACVFLVDQFPPLLLDGQGIPRYHWKKLHSFNEGKLLGLCFTQGGAAVRLLRLLQLQVASTGQRHRIQDEFMRALAETFPMGADRRFVEAEVHNDFPVLDHFYA